MPDRLMEGYRRFREGYYEKHKESLSALSEGQSPRIAVVSCCDSRVDPSLVFDATPGELFTVRNVANLVPPLEMGGRYHGTSAALEFAVQHLEVEHLVVLGHANCGGIKLLIETDGAEDPEGQSYLRNWVSMAKPALDMVQKDDCCSDQELQTICEHASIKNSLQNLMSFPWIAERVKDGRLQIHGWHYDLATSTLELITIDNE